MVSNTPTMFRTFSDRDSLQTRVSIDTTYTEEKLVFPNHAISVISAVGRHAKRTCKQLASIRGHHHEKAPDMAKMRIVTPVYDHGLGKWVWPDNVYVDEDEDRVEENRRSERGSIDKNGDARSVSRGAMLASSRTTSFRGSSSG
jgi:hypothetical protein